MPKLIAQTGRWIALLVASWLFPVHAHAALTLEACSPVKNQPAARCGTLAVPENWSVKEGRKIPLSIVVIPATGTATLPPLYDLAGGPGMSETGGAEFWLTAGSMHRAHREIVLIDQRGTGGSHPLNCALPFSDPLHEMFPPDAVRRCRTQLRRDTDLSQYSTDAAVRDLDAVRAALGHERIDLSGLSYGTRFAQAYALAHPDRVRAMALIGTVPPDNRLPLEFAADAQRTLDRLLDECAADNACARAFPRLRQELAALHSRLAGNHSELGGHAVSPGAFWEAFRGRLGTTESQRQVPWLIHALSGPDPGPALALLRSEDPSFFASGLFFSVECPEDTLHATAKQLVDSGAGTLFGNYRARRQYAACKAWGIPARESAFRKVKTLSIPALFVVGDMDYVAPPDATERARRTLPNSQVIRIPDMGHFPSGLDHMECMDEIMAAFFDAGTVEGLDTSCLSQMHALPFYTGTAPPPG
jgi:pimeloyl-ACP methyl ester carboxylesterase